MEYNKTSGNVLFLILIAVALFAALGYAVSSSNRGGNGNNGSSEKADITAANILSYQAGMKVAIDRMTVGGTMTADDIDFTRPQDAGFNTPPFDAKLFHPQGGGVVYRDLTVASLEPDRWQETVDYAYLMLDHLNPISTAYASVPQQQQPIVVSGSYVGRFNNFGWSPTSAQDIVSTAAKISGPVCQALNLKLTGSSAIPVVTNARQYLVSSTYTSTANADIDSSKCASCNNQPALCVGDTASGPYYFYNLIVSR